MNTVKDFKGTSKAFKGCELTYQQNIYDKNDMELQISHNDFNATLAYNGEKFILSYTDFMYEDTIAVISFKEAMQILKGL